MVGSNFAVTDLAAVTVTVQVAPDTDVQPVKLRKSEPAAGVAVRVTELPVTMEAVQPGVPEALQSMPLPVTVPAPVPEKETVSG